MMTFQNVETGDPIGKQYITLSVMYCNESVATRKFQSVVHVCEKRWSLIGQEAILLMNEDFGPCTVWQKLYSPLGQLT
jgi:hypothetical protein